MLQLVVIQQDLPMQLHAAFWPHIQLVKGLVLYLHEIEGLPEVFWLGTTHSFGMLPLLEVEQALFLDLVYELLRERALADHIPEVQLKVLLEFLWDNLDDPSVLPTTTTILVLQPFLILLVCGASSATGSISVSGGKTSSMRMVPAKATSACMRGEMMLGQRSWIVGATVMKGCMLRQETSMAMACCIRLTLQELFGMVLDEDAIFGDDLVFLILIKTLEVASIMHEVVLEAIANSCFFYFGTLDGENHLFTRGTLGKARGRGLIRLELGAAALVNNYVCETLSSISELNHWAAIE